jgi:hypothetical protein
MNRSHRYINVAVRPAHLQVAVEHSARRVVVVVRGSTHLRDLLLNLCAHTTPLLGGRAHWGMVQAARALLEAQLQVLAAALEANPG